MYVGVRDLDGGVPSMWLAAGQQLKEHDPGAVHVRSGVRPPGHHQLRREIGNGSDQQALGGGGTLRGDNLGEPEVGHLDPAAVADQHILRLHIAVDQSSVVGTPYWMAPEVIELSGATTASDIWSVGCTVIELIEGKPPYHKLQPMQALFRIVNDEHPPIPGSASPVSFVFPLHIIVLTYPATP